MGTNISGATAFMMTAVAVIIDLIQLPIDAFSFGIGGITVSVGALTLFAIWFDHLGVSLISNRHIGKVSWRVILELLPIGNAWFGWTTLVRRVIKEERAPEV